MICRELKKKAYDEIMSIYRTMWLAGAPMTMIPFRMAELMEEYGISKMELAMLKQEVMYQIHYEII